MSSTVVPVETNFTAQPTSALALAANPARAYLQIQNQSGSVITYKLGSDFLVPVSAVQHIGFNRVPDGGAWSLSFGANTAALTYSSDAAAIQTALEALGSIGAGNITVAGDYTAGFTFTFAGTLALMPQPLLVIGNTLTDSTAQSNAIQAINFSTPPTAGEFVVSYLDEQTGSIPFDATTTQLKDALNLLGGINGAVSTVTQDGTTKDFSITFGNAPLAAHDLELLALVSSTLTGSAALASQEVVLTSAPMPISGTFKLSNGIDTTTALAYDISAATLEAALEACDSIGVGNVDVTGSDLEDGFTITYKVARANSVQPLLFPIENLLQADTLNDAEDDQVDEIDSGNVLLAVEVITLGHGTDEVAVTFATTVPGGAAASVDVTIASTVDGIASTSDGVDIQVTKGELFDAECPTSEVWIKSVGANSPVTIYEG